MNNGMSRYSTHHVGLPVIFTTQYSLRRGTRDFHPSTLAFSNNFQYPMVMPARKISNRVMIAVTVS